MLGLLFTQEPYSGKFWRGILFGIIVGDIDENA